MRPMANRTGRSASWLAAAVPSAVGPAAATLSTGVLLVTVAGFVPNYHASPFERGLPVWLIALGFLGGLAIVAAAWVTSAERPAAAVGLAVASVGLLVPVWAGWTALPAAAQASALAFAPMAVAGIAQVGLRWSHAVRSPAPLAAIYALSIAAVIVHAIGYDPFTDPGCTRTCADVQPVAATFLSSRTAYSLAAALTGASGLLATITLVREGARGRSGVVAWAALVSVVVLSAPWVYRAAAWMESPSLVAAMLPGVLAGLLVAFAPLVAALATRRTRLDVRALVAHLYDPSLQWRDRRGSIRGVQFAVPNDGRWVDASGVEVGGAAEPAHAVVVSDSAGPALRLEIAAGFDPGEILATLTPATTLALQNARLTAVRLARLAEVRASQRRIVDASDAERQRIERDLHDGAQQRLVGASFQLSLARNGLIDGGELLSRAESTLHEALARLRQVGHGIFPPILTTEGLAAALEDLARASDVPTTIDVPELVLAPDVALAAYAVVTTALAHVGHAEATPSAQISATVHDGRLELCVRLIDSRGPSSADLVDVADRVGAVDGSLVVEPLDGGVVITAVMPCAS